jgi:uncharacterized protein (UPF0332 family)
MDGRLFLGVARFLRNKGADEAALRSAVSRAYYACFLVARQRAFNECNPQVRRKAKIFGEKGIRHEPLRDCLKNSDNDVIRQLGEDLSSLCGSRHEADYNMSANMNADDAKDAIESAEMFLSDLDKLKVNGVGSAMELYINSNYR